MRRITAVTVALVVAAALAGCVSGQDATSGALRFMNAVPDAPRLTMYVNDRARASNFDYNTGTAYIALTAGQYTVKIDAIEPDGADTDGDPDQIPVVDPDSITLGVNDEMTLVVVGQYGNETEAVQIPTRTRAVPIGKTRLQFINAAVGSPPLDVYFTAPDAPLDTTFGSALAFKAFTPQQDVDGGNSRIVITPAGDAATILFDSGSIFFSPESTLLAAIVPNLGLDAATRPYSLLFSIGTGTSTVVDKDTGTSMRFVNASPGSYAVDAFVNETTVDNTTRQVCDTATQEADTPIEACALPYEYIGSFTTLEPKSYDVKLQKADDANVLARANAGTFTAAAQSTLVINGLLADTATETALGLQIIPMPRRVADVTQLRIIDQSLAATAAVDGDPTTDRIEVYITDVGAPLADADPAYVNLRVGSDTGYVLRQEGSYQLTVAKSDTATPDVPPEVLLTQQVALDAGGIYTLIIADSVGGIAPIKFLSLDDDPAP